MRLEQLSGLIEVAKYNSINMAAKNLNTSRQALNKSLQNLEQEFNCQLLERSKKGVRLTGDGEKVLMAAQDIMTRLNVLQTDLSNADNPQERIRGNLNLCISPMLNISILPFAFAEFCSLYPNVATFTCESYRQDIISRVSKDVDTCGILLVSKLITEFFDAVPSNVELIELKTFPIYIAVSPRHPLANQKSLSVNTLSQYPIIVYEVGGTCGIHALSKLADIDVILSTNNPTLCKDILNKDHATMYSFKPYIQHNNFSDFQHIPLNDKRATFTAFIAINKEMPSSMRKIVSSFVNVFVQYL